ncbi:MAG: hypothetical protein LQ340_006119, partial [Diploschistes diacapsis]
MTTHGASIPARNLIDVGDFDDFDDDFSPDELVAIDRLLVQANSEIASPALAIADVDDYEGQHPQSSSRDVLPRSFVQRRWGGGEDGREMAGPRMEVQYDVGGWVEAQASVSAPKSDVVEDKPFVAATLTNPSELSMPYNGSASASTSPPAQPYGISLRGALSPANGLLSPSTTLDAEARSDTRSPLQRFRSPPKKLLSVTDLISPAWCELQYFYTLSKHGRKRPTAQMRRGSEIHQKLEEEIQVRVEVKTTTKEDAWALRLWNLIMGLRMLRDEGRCRELEVWGVVDREVVSGVIDSLEFR